MKVTIYGAGYVGLVTAICLAEVGHEVCCLDVDKQRVSCLKRGELPIYEEGLMELLHRNQSSGRIRFIEDPIVAVEHGLIQMIAVGTPSLSNGSADLQYVENVAHTIANHLSEYRLIVNKSTVPVGTADRVRSIISRRLENCGQLIEFDVASNPEFLREGRAVSDFLHPDRIIVGVNNEKSTALMRELYAPFIDSDQQFVVMDIRSAELTKYASNAFLATKISFMNEMSRLAECLGADIDDIRVGMGLDPRIASKYLYPGCGYGGSCFPKDVSAIKSMAEEMGLQPHILRAVMTTNEEQKAVLYHRINDYFDNHLKNKVIALWGLAFKPNTDDVREASSRRLMELLWSVGATVRAYDPMAMENIAKIYEDESRLVLCESAELALEGADVLAVVTEWDEFCTPDFQKIKCLLNHPAIFDGRNIYNPDEVRDCGIYYYGIGRRSVERAEFHARMKDETTELKLSKNIELAWEGVD